MQGNETQVNCCVCAQVDDHGDPPGWSRGHFEASFPEWDDIVIDCGKEVADPPPSAPQGAIAELITNLTTQCDAVRGGGREGERERERERGRDTQQMLCRVNGCSFLPFSSLS